MCRNVTFSTNTNIRSTILWRVQILTHKETRSGTVTKGYGIQAPSPPPPQKKKKKKKNAPRILSHFISELMLIKMKVHA